MAKKGSILLTLKNLINNIKAYTIDTRFDHVGESSYLDQAKHRTV